MLFPRALLLFLTLTLAIDCSQPLAQRDVIAPSKDISIKQDSLIYPEKIIPLTKSSKEWQVELSELEYYVLREEGTERPFTGDLLDNKEEGIYTCRGCALPLFDSSTKFKSGTGWPSFYDRIKKEYVAESIDTSYGMKRVEVHCGRCQGHLGHVFEDGPAPTGLRYCINSVSLDFVSSKNP